jgi:hypothetical protein
MTLDGNQLETLKTILENSLKPQSLDAHPWAMSLIVLASSKDSSRVQDKSSGRELVIAIEKIFAQMMPRTAPRRGKRLDTRWGEFGILAAMYFASLGFGAPTPSSLREAWEMIDQSILYFVYGKSGDALTPEEKARYKLVGDELDVASHSTLSDWHRKGLQRLMDMITARESYLAKNLSKPAVILPEDQKAVMGEVLSHNYERKRDLSSGIGRFIFPLLGLFLLGLALVGGLKAWKIYDLAQLVRKDTEEIRVLRNSTIPGIEKIRQVGPALSTLRMDFDALKTESEPFFWLGPTLEWSPLYGGELASIQDLVTVADSLLASADTSYQAIFPAIEDYSESGLNPPRLSGILNQAQPQLVLAQQELERAVAARSRMKPERFSPQVRNLILNDIDPLMALMQDGLTLAVEIPRLLGATEAGPKTYLLLAQNEDELRPTGGFITAAGTLLVQGGRISGLAFSNSGNLDNWSKLYPASPWQLNQYMNSPVLVLRDTNWFTNYPTAALYAEYLYSYTNAHSVDGVIAFDQQMLVEILSLTGPINVDGTSSPIDSGNVIAYMRAAKTPTAEDLASPDWNNKIFINKITQALVTKIFSGEIEWEKLTAVLLKTLDEHHLLLQLDSPAMTALLAEHHWDGAVRPETGDFLMVVDSNIGFNKTNAVVESSLFYDVDLTDPSAPIGSLTVVHKNKADGVLVCKQWDKIRLQGEKDYPITDCYWNYLRVYTAKGTQLLDSSPQFIPAGWMINNQSVPARVDTLPDEGIDSVQAFGSLQVVPIGESLTTSFRFALPSGVLKVEPGSGQSTYHLKVQKQPGTLAVPITIRVHLPNGSIIHTPTAKAVIQDNNVLFETNLLTDIEFEITYGVP